MRIHENWFDDYWKNYGKITINKDGKDKKITNVIDFLESEEGGISPIIGGIIPLGIFFRSDLKPFENFFRCH